MSEEEIVELIRKTIRQAIEAYMNNNVGMGLWFEESIKSLMEIYNIPEDVAFGKEKESGSGNS